MLGPIRHIVWDWNGTLFADSDAIISATCEALVELGHPEEVTPERYRSIFTHPVARFYELLLGRALRDGELHRINECFLASYHRRISGCDLAPGAREALARWQDLGRSQSLLSLSQHERLIGHVRRMGIAESFVRVDGLREEIPRHKSKMLVRHLGALGADPTRTLVVGDCVDDADAARTAGARCVLYASGQQSRAVLDTAGVPVVDSLGAALDLV